MGDRVQEWIRASAALNSEEWTLGFMGLLMNPPVGKWNPIADRKERARLAYYIFFRPMIMHVYGAVNTKNEDVIKKLMQAVILMYWVDAPAVLHGAAIVGLIPPWPAGTAPVDGRALPWEIVPQYINSWYAMLFPPPPAVAAGAPPPPDTEALSLIIQGGEAVNMYSTYKADNVPTHDTDSRFLIGNHFNYFTEIKDVPLPVRRRAHQCRFFVSTALTVAFLCHAHLVISNPAKLAEYRRKLNAWAGVPGIAGAPNLGNALFYVPAGLPIVQAVEISPGMRGHDYLGRISDGTYSMDNDIYIDRVLFMGLKIYVEGEAYPVEQGIVDMFIPRRQRVLGHSDGIHQYFSSEQSKVAFLADGRTGVTANGSTPYIITDLTFGDSIQTAPNPTVLARWGGDVRWSPFPAVLPPYNTNGIRVTPFGYLIYDSLRMLMVASHSKIRNEVGKYEKYKQKLNVLLTTVCRAETSREILRVARDAKARQPEFARVLTGGGEEEAPVVEEVPMAGGGAPEEKQPTEEEIAKAIEISDRFSESNTPVDIGDVKDGEYLGYMDYLSYIDPSFSDYRLPRPVPTNGGRFMLSIPADVEKTETSAVVETPAQSTGGARLRTYRKKRAGRRRTMHA
jgi:hypothetical protein